MMKPFFLQVKVFGFLLSTILIMPCLTYANNNCFVAKENGKIVKQIGKCSIRHSPFSTFKIPLAVMGFDSEILKSAEIPKIKFTSNIERQYVTNYEPQKYPAMLLWKRDQTPKNWMRGSVVWYSRYITHKLGVIKFKNYLNKFNYGNKNVESKVTLMNSWLGNSLKISPLEQITFIEKLVSKSLPVTKKSQEITIDIIKIETIYDDFQLYGKTGGGKSSGWFVGWIEKNNKKIIFAQYIEQSENSLINAGKMAKEVAKDNLMSLLPWL